MLDDPDSFLFHLDDNLTIALQQQRSDLFFLHGAAVASDGRVAVLSAPSGTGKSTLALALLEEGLDYLSDELAPVDLQRLTVHPYPRALCLKALPPEPYRLPRGTVEVADCFHVPVHVLRSTVHRDPLPIAALIFLRRNTVTPARPARPLTTAAAAAHLLSNALNALAHPGAGLDVAAALGRAVPCFELDSTDLRAACREVRRILRQVRTRL